MRVFIPTTNDTHNHEELRFSIRSMVKYFTDMTGVIIVGVKPKWYKGDHIPARDNPSRVDFNMHAKLMEVKGETVLYSNDDFFALKPFDKNIPNYYWKTCGERSLEAGSGRHKSQYRNCPKEWLNFDIHVPMVMDTTKFTWEGNYLHTDRPVKSNYGGQNNLPGTYLTDVKFGEKKADSFPFKTYENIMESIEDKMFFSTSPFCMNPAMNKVLNELYPEKSIYEE